MELFSVKLIVLVLMGAIRILCGMLPLAIVKAIKGRWSKTADRRLKKCISVLVFFGGGVMLATCFLHMMPEVQEIFNEALPKVHLPIAQIVFVMGFFLVYMMEDIVHALIHKRKRAKRQKKNKKAREAGEIGAIIALPYNNNDPPAALPIAVIGKKNGDYLNEGFCYANNYPSADHYRKPVTSPLARETKELFDKNVVRKCDDIPGLPRRNHSISTTNIQTKPLDGNERPGNGRIANGLVVGVDKFSYTDPEWYRDTVIVNSPANLLGNSTPSLIDNNANRSRPMHDLHLNKSQGINVISDDSNSNSSSSGSTRCSRKQLHHESSLDKKDVDSSQDSQEQDDDHEHDHFHHEHSHIPVAFLDGEDELDQTIGAEIRNLLIVIAISFHGIFEGLAIGLQDSVEDVWYMFFAVSLHECTILFCIGIELISNQTKIIRMVIYVLIVSLVSPVGIAIGIVISENSFSAGGAQALVVGSFQGLAAGSLLYVTFFEIFQEEGRKLNRKYVHILVALLGFVLMGSLEFLGGHSHGGSSSTPHTHGHNHEGLGEHADHADHHHNETNEAHHHHHHDDHHHPHEH